MKFETKGVSKVKKNVKRNIGDFAIYLGKHAVGKCMIPGMFDPKIPNALRSDMKKDKRS